VFESCGGPDRTRICDLYRVKVDKANQLEEVPLKNKDLDDAE